MSWVLVVAVIIFTTALLLNAAILVRGKRKKCFWGCSFMEQGRAEKAEPWYKTYESSGKKVPGSDFQRTRVTVLQKCPDCENERGLRFYLDTAHLQTYLTANLAKKEIDEVKGAIPPSADNGQKPVPAKKTSGDGDSCVAPLIPEKQNSKQE